MRRNFLPYIQHYNPAYKVGWMHALMARRLQRFSFEVEQERSPRLMLLMPPRHGKSTQSSLELPGWHLGRCPHHEFISASYNISLPLGFSRKIRTRMREASYRALFPDAELDPESQSAESWNLLGGGSFLAAGVGGGITGKGAHILSIDDPIKNAEEADSETIRETLWDWYGSTAYTRLSPGGGVLITQTWWHDADLAGRIQYEMKEDPDWDQFEILRFPAIAEEDEWLTAQDTIWRPSDGSERPEDATLLREKGQPLHEDRYDVPKLLKIKKTLTPRHWSALYQQNPVPDEGAFFTKSMFTPFVREQHNGVFDYIQAWDLAASEKQQNDWTVGVTIGLDSDDNMVVIDVIRFKGDSFLIVEAILDQYEKYKAVVVGVEDSGQQWKAIRPILLKRSLERRLYPVIEELKALTDKQSRAAPLQGRMQMHKVLFPMDAPWLEKLKHEMLRFGSGGIHDDQVDALAWAARLCVDRAPPRIPGVKAPRPKKSWKNQLDSMLRGGVGHLSA
jgi:predicted phage terminase large subunit-like protein